MDNEIRIERLENGFEVCCPDPEQARRNAKSKEMWRDPKKEYVFKTEDEVVAFIKKKLPMLKGMSAQEEYNSEFGRLSASDE